VTGGLIDPTALRDKPVRAARERVGQRISELVPFASEHGVRLVLEPLHPMDAPDRAVPSTLRQALDHAAPFPSSTVEKPPGGRASRRRHAC
jgi:sugar phosphate isomerase/epimerase